MRSARVRNYGSVSRPKPWRKLFVEQLEERQLLATALHLDFGTANSPVMPGYQQALPLAYSQARGFGWIYSLGLAGIDRSGLPDALRCDFNQAQQGQYFADLVNGTYSVTLTFGDANTSTSGTYVWAQGQLVASNVSTTRGQFTQVTFQ